MKLSNDGGGGVMKWTWPQKFLWLLAVLMFLAGMIKWALDFFK